MIITSTNVTTGTTGTTTTTSCEQKADFQLRLSGNLAKRIGVVRYEHHDNAKGHFGSQTKVILIWTIQSDVADF